MAGSRHPLVAFARTALFGGLAVLLPVLILAFLLNWLFRATRAQIRPLTEMLAAQSHVQGLVADALVIVSLVVFCFLLGLVVQTRLGAWLHTGLETWLFARVPGYQLVKDTVAQFIGRDRASPFQAVCLLRPFGEAWMTGFITARHADGRVTVFVPNAPLPTTGLVFHVAAADIQELPGIGVEQAMRTVMACGAGSQSLITISLKGASRR
ncbi:MAG: DUF502 domain-containing protein [Gammaproteobacteria bacterium]|nr:DUF502 domain-containing protein [Gammaproteobacteria bacterium]